MKDEVVADRVALIAAAVASYAMFAIVPLAVEAIAVLPLPWPALFLLFMAATRGKNLANS